MFKYKMIVLILLMAVFTSKGHCLENAKDQQIKTIAGKVDSTDTAGNVVNVQTDAGKITFYISVESDLFKSAHHIASIEIEKGDFVVIQYTKSSSGRNIIVKLVDNEPDKY